MPRGTPALHLVEQSWRAPEQLHLAMMIGNKDSESKKMPCYFVPGNSQCTGKNSIKALHWLQCIALGAVQLREECNVV